MIALSLSAVLLSYAIATVSTCQMLVPPELLNGCTFSSLTIMNPINGFSVNRFNCNEVIHKDVFTEQPYVYFNNADEGKSYTIVMIDPDSPSHTADQFYLHWVVTNVPGYILRQGLGYTVGDTLMEYTGPSPAAFSGPHRFMIFVYEQMSTYITAPLPPFRTRFDIIDWMESFGGEDAIRGPVASVGTLNMNNNKNKKMRQVEQAIIHGSSYGTYTESFIEINWKLFDLSLNQMDVYVVWKVAKNAQIVYDFCVRTIVTESAQIIRRLCSGILPST